MDLELVVQSNMGRPAQASTLGPAALLAGFLIWLFFMPNLHPMPTDTSIRGHNHIDRPVHRFWVNERGGGNLGAMAAGAQYAASELAVIPPRWSGFLVSRGSRSDRA